MGKVIGPLSATAMGSVRAEDESSGKEQVHRVTLCDKRRKDIRHQGGSPVKKTLDKWYEKRTEGRG